MVFEVDVLCTKDIRDAMFDCKEGKRYTFDFNTGESTFKNKVNSMLVGRMSEGYFIPMTPWKYLPEVEYLPKELYAKIPDLTEFCRVLYKKTAI